MLVFKSACLLLLQVTPFVGGSMQVFRSWERLSSGSLLLLRIILSISWWFNACVYIFAGSEPLNSAFRFLFGVIRSICWMFNECVESLNPS